MIIRKEALADTKKLVGWGVVVGTLYCKGLISILDLSYKDFLMIFREMHKYQSTNLRPEVR